MTELFIRIEQGKLVDNKTGLSEYSISCTKTTNNTSKKEEIIIVDKIRKCLSKIFGEIQEIKEV